MMRYLYKNWAYMGLLIALYVTLVLVSSLKEINWIAFLIWLQFPIYLVHEFEEHAYPGHFKETVNREVFHVMDRDVPLTEVSIFWINILAVWVLFPLGAVLAQTVDLRWGILLPVFGLFNSTLHILSFLVKRKYNPGLLVSVFLNYPTGIYTLAVAHQAGLLDTWTLTYAIGVTVVAHLVIVAFAAYRYRQYLKAR